MQKFSSNYLPEIINAFNERAKLNVADAAGDLVANIKGTSR
jgi:hypothetical protein